MPRRVFYSFQFAPDHWRASQVRNMGVVVGQAPASDNDWEAIAANDRKIELWIDQQMRGTTCTVVLIGADTEGRRWINYEIQKAWGEGKGLVGVHIHGLLDQKQHQSPKGRNPFDRFSVGSRSLSELANVYDPPYRASTDVYAWISEGLGRWIETAIRVRDAH